MAALRGRGGVRERERKRVGTGYIDGQGHVNAQQKPRLPARRALSLSFLSLAISLYRAINLDKHLSLSTHAHTHTQWHTHRDALKYATSFETKWKCSCKCKLWQALDGSLKPWLGGRVYASVCVCVTSSYTRPAAGETWARLVEKHIIISTQIRLDNASYSLIDGCLIASRRRGRHRERGREEERGRKTEKSLALAICLNHANCTLVCQLHRWRRLEKSDVVQHCEERYGLNFL